MNTLHLRHGDARTHTHTHTHTHTRLSLRYGPHQVERTSFKPLDQLFLGAMRAGERHTTHPHLIYMYIRNIYLYLRAYTDAHIHGPSTRTRRHTECHENEFAGDYANVISHLHTHSLSRTNTHTLSLSHTHTLSLTHTHGNGRLEVRLLGRSDHRGAQRQGCHWRATGMRVWTVDAHLHVRRSVPFPPNQRPCMSACASACCVCVCARNVCVRECQHGCVVGHQVCVTMYACTRGGYKFASISA